MATDGWGWTIDGGSGGDEDIRDPKFAPIGDRLFLYALKNTDFAAEPYQTVYAMSEDGISWSPFQEMEPKGWLFWRPKTQDGSTWYAPAYWHGHGRADLLRSQDGVDWTMEYESHEGDRSDEPAIEFLPDGRLLATVRLEMSDSLAGHPEGSTLITTFEPLFGGWKPGTRSKVTRLDGPALFDYNGRVYAVGSYQPTVAGPFGWQGSIFGRTRTLYRIEEDGLVHLSDLPSAGDTSYAGLVRRGDNLYISYYTSDVDRDYPWILGLVSPSAIRMARISLPSLEALGEAIAG